MKNFNTLRYKTSEWNRLSFELLVDEKPLAEIVGFQDKLIPYWIIKEGLPVYKWTGELIVAVCGCGEYGCDCVLCKSNIKDDSIIFSDFRRERYSNLPQIEFRFTTENFQDVELKLKAAADEKRRSFEKR